MEVKGASGIVPVRGGEYLPVPFGEVPGLCAIASSLEGWNMQDIKPCLDEAVAADVGIEAETDDRELFKNKFYRLRRDDSLYSGLSLYFHPSDPHRVYIFHTELKDKLNDRKPN